MLRYASIVVVILATAALFDSMQQSHVQAAHPKESLVIIVNRENPIENLSMADLRTIFLGERSHWPNGRRITLVMMDPGMEERNAVLRDICRMSETEFSRHFL